MKFKKLLASALAAVMTITSLNVVNVIAATGDDYINYLVGNNLNTLLERSSESIDSLTIPSATTLLRLDKGYAGIWANTREITEDDVKAVVSFYDRSGNKIDNPDFSFVPFALTSNPSGNSAGICQKVTTTGDKYAAMADFLVVNYNSYSYYIPFIASPANLHLAENVVYGYFDGCPQKPKKVYCTNSGAPNYYLAGYQNGVKFADTYGGYKFYWDFCDESEVYFLNESEKSRFVSIPDTETTGDFYSKTTDTDGDLYWINGYSSSYLYANIESGTINLTTGDVFKHYVPVAESSVSNKTYNVKYYKPSGIKIAELPSKTNYVAGETFDPTGLKVVLNCSDSLNEFEVTNYTYDEAPLSVGDTYINIYTSVNGVGKVYTTVPVNVVAKSVDSIEIITPPSKTDYVEGETLSLDGAEIKATYNDGTTEIIDNRYIDIEYSNGKALNENDSTVTVSYGGKTADIDVNVTKKQIVSIKVVHQPDKINYVAGETFDLAGIEVEATYNDGTTAMIEDYTYSPDAYLGSMIGDSLIGDVNRDGNIDKTDAALVLRYASGTSVNTAIDLVAADCNRDGNIDELDSIWILRYKPGMAFITVSKDNNSDYFYVNVEDRAVTSIKVAHQPNKTEYIDGQQFDSTGLVVEAVYNDGTSEIIEDYTIENNTVTSGMTNVHITYGNVYTTVPITVLNKNVVKLEVTHQPVKTEYVDGQEFDNTGLVVKATYTDGSTAIIDDYTITPDKLSIGDTVVTLAKDGVNTTVPVTVVERVVDHIEVTRLPNKLDYNEGEVFNPDGMEITAVYNDGSKTVITDYTYDNSPLTAGDTKVTVSYDGKTADVKIILSLSDSDIKNLVPVKNGDVNRDGFVTPEDAAILIKYLNNVERDFNIYSVRTGDVDCDGVLTESDAGLIRNYLKGNVSITDEVNADIDGDNEVTEYDAVLVDKAALGMWSLDTVYEDNADANDDGEINMLDVIWIINTYYRHTTVDSIEIVKAPDKIKYVEGQAFNPEGMEVVAIYKDGTRENLTNTDYTYPVRPLTTDDNNVIIEFEGKKAEQPIEVIKKAIVGSDNDKSDEENNGNSEGIRIISMPTKTEYIEGQIFDADGLKIEVSWNDGSVTYITADDVTIDDTPFKIGDCYGVIYYSHNDCIEKINVPVTVIGKEISSVEIIKYPDKSEYVEGQEFDPTGTEIKITNNDGTEEIYYAKDIEVKDNKPLTINDDKVTVIVGGTEVDIPITVVERKPVKVEITENTDREYVEGEMYDPSGIKGEISYNDGTKEEFNSDDVTVKDDRPLTTNDNKVTIIVDGIETEVDVVVNSKPTTEVTTETATEATTKNHYSGGAGGSLHVDKTTETTTESTTTEITTEAATEATTDNRFEDVIDHWAEDYIEYLHKNGIVQGVTNKLFMPDLSTKRGDFAIVLDRLLNLEQGYMTFEDVSHNSYYAHAIANCASAGIFIGYGDGTFKPEQTITREEMMVIMAKVFAGNDYNFVTTSVLDKYDDGSSVSEWAAPYVSYLAENNIIVGDNGNIRPQDSITRAEMAAIIYNYLNK
ncbi:MAG: bacterial Ig-like domain-containing protein [Clostridia bacterium]|nr:bacterial Ig-like domain-containing protein [Clostridia bacterium]